ncbi:MAG: YciI family protein [Terriglobales bacterium]
MKYVNYVTYTTDKTKIAAHRPAHREYLSGLLKQGKLVASGPFTDDSGAMFIYEADSPEAASALVAGDPFSVNGVFQKLELKPWKLVFSNAELLRANS